MLNCDCQKVRNLKQGLIWELWGLWILNTNRIDLHTPTVRSAGPGNAPQRPEFLKVPIPGPATLQTSRLSEASYTFLPPEPLPHETVRLLSLEYSVSSRSPATHQSAGKKFQNGRVTFQFSRCNNCDIPNQRPARFKISTSRRQPGRRAQSRPWEVEPGATRELGRSGRPAGFRIRSAMRAVSTSR